MKELVDCILRTLVDRPEEIRVSMMEGDKTLLYEVRCHKDDLGKLIGKNGKTVSSIRGLLNAVAARKGRRAFFEVVE